MSANLADIVLGLFLVAASVTWLAAGRTPATGLAMIDQPSRQRHPSSRPLTPPGAPIAPYPPADVPGAGRTP